MPQLECLVYLRLIVRHATSLGTQSGCARKSRAYSIGLKGIELVRVKRVSGRKSSKRVQTGEPH